MPKPHLHKLPVEAYTSREWFDREQAQIFSRTWRYAGLREDIAEPGQHLAVQAGLNNLFVIMGRDRRLRAFHNRCRHRGTQLIRAVGKAKKALTCPYHDWTYDLEGRLVSVPDEAQEYGQLDKSCLGLRPASVDIWRGMIFVHPDPQAEPIGEWFGPMEPHLGPHDVDAMPEYEEGGASYEIAANWKIVVDNYIDVYHLSHLHSGTLAMYDHRRAEYGFVGPHFAFWEPPSADFAADIEGNSPYPLVIPAEQAGAWVPMLFPGIGLAESESSWANFVITPLAPDRTRVDNRVRVADLDSWAFAKQARRSQRFWESKISPKYDEQNADGEDDPMASGDFTAEDIYTCEAQQLALSSPGFETGPAAAGEQPILDHQQVVLDYLEARW